MTQQTLAPATTTWHDKWNGIFILSRLLHRPMQGRSGTKLSRGVTRRQTFCLRRCFHPRTQDENRKKEPSEFVHGFVVFVWVACVYIGRFFDCARENSLSLIAPFHNPQSFVSATACWSRRGDSSVPFYVSFSWLKWSEVQTATVRLGAAKFQLWKIIAESFVSIFSFRSSIRCYGSQELFPSVCE